MNIKKDENTLCGPSCIEYILGTKNIFSIEINKKEIWCCNLATTLQELGFQVVVRCYNSNLYIDTFKFPTHPFEGFKSIRKYQEKNNIEQMNISKKILCDEINSNDFCIYNLSSKIFNNKESGGHYIIAQKADKDYVDIINPKKNIFSKERISFEKLINCLQDFGCWRILIK